MEELRITYRCRDQDGVLMLWVRVNDDPEMGPVALDGPDSKELTELFNRMTGLLQRIQKRTPVPPAVPDRPSHIRSLFWDEKG